MTLQTHSLIRKNLSRNGRDLPFYNMMIFFTKFDLCIKAKLYLTPCALKRERNG